MNAMTSAYYKCLVATFRAAQSYPISTKPSILAMRVEWKLFCVTFSVKKGAPPPQDDTE